MNWSILDHAGVHADASSLSISSELLSFPLICPTKMPQNKLYVQTQVSRNGAPYSLGPEQQLVRYACHIWTLVDGHKCGGHKAKHGQITMDTCFQFLPFSWKRGIYLDTAGLDICQSPVTMWGWIVLRDVRCLLHDLGVVTLILLKWLLNS